MRYESRLRHYTIYSLRTVFNSFPTSAWNDKKIQKRLSASIYHSRTVQVVIPGSPGACWVIATQVLGLCPKAGAALRTIKNSPAPALQSSLHLFQDPAELLAGFFHVAGFVALLGKEFEAVGVVAGDDVEVGVEHLLPRSGEIVHTDVESLGE